MEDAESDGTLGDPRLRLVVGNMGKVVQALSDAIADRSIFEAAVADAVDAVMALTSSYASREWVPRALVAEVFAIPYFILMVSRRWVGADLEVAQKAADVLDDALVQLFGRGYPML